MQTFIGLMLVSFTSALVYEDCNSSPNKVLHFEHGTISTDPVQIPGEETIEVDVKILKDINGHHHTLDLVITKKGLLDLKVPCIQNVGSCSYDLCDLLTPYRFNDTEHHCPLIVAETSPDFPCACPFKAGNYHLNQTTFEIPELNSLFTWLSQGKYELDAKIIEKETNEEVACYHIEASVGEECKGLGCIIGKRRRLTLK